MFLYILELYYIIDPYRPGIVCVGIGCVRVALCLAGRQVVCKQPGSLIGRENKGGWYENDYPVFMV